MTNRTDEYRQMVQELAQPPKDLEGSVARARKKACRARLIQTISRPAAALAGAAACFVLMVNAFPTFALACSEIPIIRELAAAAVFSPSLSAAVAHNYVQYIGQSQTIDGLTVNLEYAITDRNQTVFFYTVKGGRLYTSPDISDPNGESIGGYAATYGSGEDNGLNNLELSFVDGENALPERFTMKMFFKTETKPLPEQMTAVLDEAPSTAAPNASLSDPESDICDPRTELGVVCLSFDVTLDPSRIVEPIIVPVNRWVELNGQRIQVDHLEYTPTRTVMYLGEDDANTAWLTSLKFWFEDENGTRYDNVDGSLSASCEADSKSYLTYYFQSFYYNPPKDLSLCVDKAEWLDKDAPRVRVDLTNGTATDLPDGVQLGEITRTDAGAKLEFISSLERQNFGQTFTHSYWDPQGNKHEYNTSSYSHLNDKILETIYLGNCPWDVVELEARYSRISIYSQPVYVPLTPGGN